ncbi:MAG: L-glutamate gamma-semialdehyde dehydrogenase [Burkholderiales bacterium]|nr:L-glutamate gamma-semialdehyde dehydrogenase [Burkholderiales bacterium]
MSAGFTATLARARLPSSCRPEAQAAAECLRRLAGAIDWAAVAARATPWLESARRDPAPFWAVETLLREYPISSAEGAALMRLAEALLRVPDRETAIAFTADQLGRAAFEGRGAAGLAAWSARALAFSKLMLPGGNAGKPAVLGRLGAETVVAIALRAVQLLGRQFVLGETLGAAMARAEEWRNRYPAFRFSYDMLGEGARTREAAARYLEHYLGAVDALAAQPAAASEPERRDGISIKLSALFQRYEEAQRARVLNELVPVAWRLCERAARAMINLTIDAEESERLELSLDVFEALARRAAAAHSSWRGLGLAVQAYQTRALDVVECVLAIAKRCGIRVMVRLVKGAYWDAEIKRAQVLGNAAYPVYTHKHHSDVSYLACARLLLSEPGAAYAQFASHNAGTIASILALAEAAGAPFELQRLHGMGESVYREVLKDAAGVSCRVYAPVGEHRDLLAYLVRRLLENGANSSFLRQLGDPAIPVPALLASPLRVAPRPALPLPPELYGAARRNSRGIDVAARDDLARLVTARPVAASVPAPRLAGELAETVGALQAGFAQWSEQPVAGRSAILRRAADLLEARAEAFCGLIVAEARKTWDDAVAEVREAVDFLRYYAAEAERVLAPRSLPGPTGESNELRLRGRGVWACISPWNFPLAIFTGQVAAALVTGNTVAAKPAEQTPVVAAVMVELLHQAGVPDSVLALCAGDGESVGAALVADHRIAGVAFTGSTVVARAIARSLAEDRGGRLRPIVPLVAETGGVNAMIVDSSALPEQVVDAVVHSAFRSAGQRCSALRLLCVHQEVAEVVLGMLASAMAELAIGDPADPATDVGPLIDTAAKRAVEARLAGLDAVARFIARSPLPAGLAGDYVAPCAYEVAGVESVTDEIFGPVLQVVRWSGEVELLVARINALGFGLTLGVQTRVDRRAERIAVRARVGNVYVNRGMTGAVVGVQPFGGEGLSGTGPKAGGPHYLLRFCAEQTVTINTAAAGGNPALLAGETTTSS